MVWGTVYFQKIIKEMRAEDIHVRDKDSALSTEIQGGQLRSTANPETASATS
ncbi:hypothetical protein ACOZDF_34630 [Streptomyces griseoincarnatus]